MIFVTGATGLAGSDLVPLLQQKKAPLRVGCFSPSRASYTGAETVPLTNDIPALRDAMQGCDSLFLVSPFTVDQVMREERLVTAAKQAGVRRIVKQSVLGVEEENHPPLAAAHLEIEAYIVKNAFEWTFLRPAPFMQDFALHNGSTIRKESLFYRLSGEVMIAYVDARDVAAVAAEALLNTGHEGKTYHLTGPEPLTNREVSQILTRTLGRPIRFHDVQEQNLEDARLFLLHEGMGEESVRSLIELHQVERGQSVGEVTDIVETVTKRPPISFERFCSDYRTAFAPVEEPGERREEGRTAVPNERMGE
jgi:uncharacterized protein YbjT (DUF2867 family)